MFDPRQYGAETKAVFGVFLVGAAFGGILDATLNIAGFAEPLVFAGLCGSGALGVKKMLDSQKSPKPPGDNGA